MSLTQVRARHSISSIPYYFNRVVMQFIPLLHAHDRSLISHRLGNNLPDTDNMFGLTLGTTAVCTDVTEQGEIIRVA